MKNSRTLENDLSQSRQKSTNSKSLYKYLEENKSIHKKNPQTHYLIADPKPEFPPIRFVLDIDETLATRVFEDKQEAMEKKTYFKWFQERDLIITFYMKHELYPLKVFCFIHPGVLEFIQYIFLKIPKVELAFYSSGLEEINDPFVKLLLIKALGNKRYFMVKDSIPIFSKNRCIKEKGFYKKNLLITKNEEEAVETLLIDDNKNVIYAGQEKNVLITPGAQYCHFIDNENIFHSNHIFYVTGLITAALRHRKKGFLLCLNELQELINDENRQIFYWQGLQALQSINSEVSFFSDNLYAAIRFGHKCLIEKMIRGENIGNISRATNNTLNLEFRNNIIKINIINCLIQPNTIYLAISEKHTALSYAIKNNSSQLVKVLIQHGMSLNVGNIEDMDGLLVTIIQNRFAVLNALFPDISKDKRSLPVDSQTKPELFLLVINYLMNLLVHEKDIIAAYENICHVTQQSEFKNYIDSVKKISQVRILTIAQSKNKFKHLAEQESNNIAHFLKSSEPCLFHFFRRNYSSFDVYKKIQNDDKDAKQAYIEKCKKVEVKIQQKLNAELKSSSATFSFNR